MVKSFKVHELKTIEPFYSDVKSGIKSFEVRINDRNFQVGDFLVLKQYDQKNKIYSGDAILREIKYILTQNDYPDGLMNGYVILGLKERDGIYGKFNS